MSISSFYRHFISLHFQSWCHTTHLLVTAVKTSQFHTFPKADPPKSCATTCKCLLTSLSSHKWAQFWKNWMDLASFPLSSHLCFFLPNISPCSPLYSLSLIHTNNALFGKDEAFIIHLLIKENRNRIKHTCLFPCLLERHHRFFSSALTRLIWTTKRYRQAFGMPTVTKQALIFSVEIMEEVKPC